VRGRSAGGALSEAEGSAELEFFLPDCVIQAGVLLYQDKRTIL